MTNKILIFTGAGLSAESGISTFRDSQGLWEQYDPEVVCNIHTFPQYKDLTFEFYNKRRKELEFKVPNAAHAGIAELQKQYGIENVSIFTQNIDDLLEKAGCVDVKHVHGFATEMMCLNNTCKHVWDVGYTDTQTTDLCPECHHPTAGIKPGVVFFGENAPLYQELYSTFGHSREDLIVVMGTAGEVVPLERIAGNRRSTHKSFTVLNNKDHDKYGPIDYKLFDRTFFKPATEAWPDIKGLADWFMAGK